MPRSPAFFIFRSELQARVLGLVLLNPGRSWTVAELAERVGTTPLAVNRELSRATAAGVVHREPVGRAFLYRPATDSPLVPPLAELLERTVGIGPQITDALHGVPGVRAAFLHGSIVDGKSLRSTSDVDVLLLGTAEPRTVRRRLREVEQRIGREIDAVVYRPDEFAGLLRERNGFARAIVSGPVEPLIGSVDDLRAEG